MDASIWDLMSPVLRCSAGVRLITRLMYARSTSYSFNLLVVFDICCLRIGKQQRIGRDAGQELHADAVQELRQPSRTVAAV